VDCLEYLKTINDICLYVDDFEACERFYTEKFGLKVIRRQAEPQLPKYLLLDFHGTGVALWEKNGALKVLEQEHYGGEGHRFIICVLVPSVDIVDEIHRELTQRGVTCIKEPQTYPFKCRSAYYADPEKNIWEVFSYIEGAADAGLVVEEQGLA
jgi:catechol 2,3-dioxygenase-like lactoylglutathione lyase family enzyme